jgi:DNA polymerase-3 subunit alpha
MAEALDAAAGKMQKGLRVFLRNETPIDSVARRLETNPQARSGPDRPDGEVSVVLMLGEGTEVEIKLPGRFKVTPQVAGAIKAVPGVVEVQSF